jgi:hypothetical protein
MWLQNLECRHCHNRTISPWRKQLIGPWVSAACPSCGGAVGVPHYAFLFIWPFAVLAIVAYRMIDSIAIFGILVVAIFVLASWIQHRYVPLIGK